LGSANLDTQIADIPTVAEFNARTLPSADYFVVGDYTAPPSAATIVTQIEASTVIAKEATVNLVGLAVVDRPTLAAIEGSAVLAKEATVAAKASQTSVDGKPTLAQIEASTVLPTKTDVQNAGLL
jgi:hypothetical protein